MLWFVVILLLIILALFAYLIYIQKEIKDKDTNTNIEVDTLNGTIDAFGRQRISSSFTIGDYKHTYGTSFEFLTSTNNGSINYPTDKSEALLEINAGVSGHVYYQTKKYHNYLPGKAQYILCSFVMGSNSENVTKKIGYFDGENGVYFQQEGDGTLSFVIRSNVTRTPEERIVNQIDWNGEELFDLDITKTQLMFIDFQWLGVGKVRCGFVNKNHTYIAHTFYNSNVLDTVYISNPTLPIRAEIENTTTITTNANMRQICSTVISEGGYSESGYDYSHVFDAGKAVTTDTPVLALRLKNTFNGYNSRGIISIDKLEVLADTDTISYKLVKISDSNNLNGAWNSISDRSMAEINTTVTSGVNSPVQIDAGFVTADKHGSRIVGNPANRSGSATKTNFIAQNLDCNNSEAYVILATALGGTPDAYASIKWREIY